VLGGGIVEENVSVSVNVNESEIEKESANGRLWLEWVLVSVWRLYMRHIRDGFWEVSVGRDWD